MTSSEDSKDNIDVPPKKLRLNLSDINAYITCVICKGYLINATTLTECLHSFCKTCIVRYLNTSKSCPICDVQVHKTKPLLNIRSDKTLQDIVYKMVPGLYKAEMRRRRQFYLKHSSPCETSPEERGEIDDRIIYSPDEKISLSLEFYTPEMAELYHKRLYQYRSKAVLGENSSVHPKDTNPAPTSIRYLCCPAAVTVHHLQRFIKMKFNLGTLDKVEIIYCGEVLKSNWTLMDVAYIYTWRRNGPIRFFFQIIAGQKRNFNWCLVPKSTKDTEEVADENNPPKLAVEKIDHCVNGEKETKVDKENDGAIHSSSNALNNIGTFINGKVPLKDNISLAIREKPVLASGDTATNSDKPQATINKSRLGVNQLPVPNGKLMTVSDKPTNVPVKIATVPNRPIQLNPAPVVHNTNQKSEGSKTIAELINERILKQKKHRVTSGELNGTNWANKQNPNNNNNNDKSNIRNDIYQFPMAPSSLPILHCVVPEPKVKNTIVVNGRSDYGKIPIAPRPPQGSFQNPFDINRMRNGGFDANSIHKLVPLNNRQYVANIKGKVYKKRKIAPNDEANSAKVAKISNGNEPKNAVAPVTPLVTQAPAMPPMAPNHSTVSAPVSNSPTLTPANDQSDSRKCLESAKGNNKKSNKDSSSAKCDNDVQKMDSNDDEGGKEKVTTNAEPQLLDASESSDCKSPSHMEERASRESPPPNSLVIVTSPEDSAKSPQPSTTSSKKDDKSKEKTRKQKSLDEVVKNLSMVTKEVKRNEGPTNVNGATKEGEKRGVRPFFSPLDLSSRKHMNLPVIPAPLPPTTICPTSKHYKPLASAASKSNNGNKSPSTPTAENLLRSYRNTQSSKNQSDKNCPTSAAVNGHNKTTSSAVANHQSRKSPDGTPKSLPNGAKKTMESLKNVPIAPSSASSSTNVSATRPQSGVPSSPTALPSFIPNRHVFYNKQQLDLINKFGSQFFNSAMLYNNMVRPSRDGLSNKAPKKL